MITKIAFIISFLMTIYHFYYSLTEDKRMNKSTPHVNTTIIFSTIMAFIFSGLAYLFI